MKQMKTAFLRLALTALVGLPIAGIPGSAGALTMYNTFSSVSFTLTDVIGASDDWSVSYDRYLIDEHSETDGDGSVEYFWSPESSGNLEIGKTVSLTTGAKGKTGSGIADSTSYAGLDILVETYAAEELIFNFDFEYRLFADVTGLPEDDTSAVADIYILDDFFSIDIMSSVEVNLLDDDLYRSFGGSGSFSFALYDDGSGGGSNLIWAESSVLNYSTGGAVPAPVPEPAAMILMGIGLAAFGGVSRMRKKST